MFSFFLQSTLLHRGLGVFLLRCLPAVSGRPIVRVGVEVPDLIRLFEEDKRELRGTEIGFPNYAS